MFSLLKKLSFSDEVCFGLAQARCERIHINYFRIPRTTVNEDMENNDGIPEPKNLSRSHQDFIVKSRPSLEANP